MSQIISLLHSKILQWLLISLRIKSKVLTFTSKATHVLATGFLWHSLLFSPSSPPSCMAFLSFLEKLSMFPSPLFIFTVLSAWNAVLPAIFMVHFITLFEFHRYMGISSEVLLDYLFKAAHAWTHGHIHMPISIYDFMTCMFICLFSPSKIIRSVGIGNFVCFVHYFIQCV